VAFTAAEVVITDDNGIAGNTGDDFNPTFVASSDVGNDGILSPGEMWTYTASAIAQDLMTPGGTSTFNFSGSTATDGTDGNIRTFTAGGVSVKTSAFSRDKSTGAWSAAYLGSYSGGLGVTDSSEGSGTGITFDPSSPNHLWITDSADGNCARAAERIGQHSPRSPEAELHHRRGQRLAQLGFTHQPAVASLVQPDAGRIERQHRHIIA
jgi:hypothetical protein